MSLPVVIASNQTAGAITLDRLGLTVPASGTLTLTDFAFVNEIKQDESLHAAIVADEILLDLGQGEITKGDSLKFFAVATLEVRRSVRALAAANVASLSGTTTIDTVALAVDDRVLLTAQTTGSENGIWVVKAGAWQRPSDFETGDSAAAAIITIQEGGTYADQVWQVTSNSGSDIIGTSTLALQQISGGGGGGVTNLQGAYDGGNTIVTAGATPIAFTLTSGDFTVDDGSVLFGGSTPLTAFNVDTGTMSLDSTASSNITLTGNSAGTETLTLSATNAGAGTGALALSSDGVTDIDAGGALSLNSSGGAINIGDDAVAQPINIGTGAAVRTITIGNSTGATALDIDSGTGGTLIDSTGIISLDGVGSSNFTTDAGNLTLSTTTSGDVLLNSAGAGDFQTSGNLTLDSDTGSIDIGGDADDGAINIGTGTTAGRVITIGSNTGTTGVAIETGTGNFLVDAPLTTLTGNLLVQGTTTTVESEIVNVADNFLYLNDGYTSTTGLEGGIVVNNSATGVASTNVDTGAFTAGVPATSNPTVAVTDASNFSVGSFIQISGANDQTNDGLYEVLSINTAATPDILTIAGVGLTGTTFQFTQNDFTTDATVAGVVTEVDVGVIQISSAGVLQYGFDNNASTLTFNDVTTGASALTLQNAYVGGNTITTSAGEGSVIVAGTEELQITATGGLNLDTVFDADVTTFDVLMTGNNGFSIDGTADSNITVTNTVATTDITQTISAVNTGATSGDATVDITATSTNGSGIVEVQADAINIGTDAAANTTTIGNNTGATGVVIDSGTEQVEIDGVTYYGTSAGLPTATTSGFQDGDKYYDSTLDMEMRYDAARAKWLSVETMTLMFGRDGNQAVDTYYRGGADGRVMSATAGYIMPFAGTIVGLGYTRTDTDAATFDVVEGGTSRATLASAATSGQSRALNGDFSQNGILAVMNQAGGNTTSNVIGWVQVKFRGT